MIYGDELSKKILHLEELRKQGLFTDADQSALEAYQDSMKLYLKCKDEELKSR